MNEPPCVCGHAYRDHERDEACRKCSCPWYCEPEVAEEIIYEHYEHDLAEGKPWAEQAYEYRRANRRRPDE